MRTLLALAVLALAPLSRAQDVVLFHDDFEAGLSNWTHTGLWRHQDVSAPCSWIAAPFPSGTHCAWFGDPVSCTFETNFGWGWIDGDLIQVSTLSLPANANSIRLTLRTNSEGEDDQVWDRRTAYVRVDETGNWISLGNILSSTWQTAQFDLTPYAGHVVRVRLEFWVGDGAANGFYGWFLDDVTVTASNDVAIPFCTGDGLSGACPCGNLGGSGRGCPSSFQSQGALLTATGLPSISNDTLALQASDVSPAPVTFFAGQVRTPAGAALLFGDGMRCITGTVNRVRAFPDVSGVAQIPVPGGLPLSQSLVVTGMNPTRYVQALYRNAAPFCTSGTFNLTNGLIVTWHP